MAAKQLTINRLLAPLFSFARYREQYYKSGEFASDMASKMAEVPEESMISPAPNVAAQAMEGLSYSLDEPDLKGMYLNLLATASDSRSAGDAHPSYAGVIRQLSAVEAGLLPLFLPNRSGEPMAEIRLKSKDPGTGFQVLRRHIVDMRSRDDEPVEIQDWSIYVDNWVRLGLVTADYQTYRLVDGAYDFVQSRPEYLHQSFTDTDKYELSVQQGLMIPTDFGMRFGIAVEADQLPQSPTA